MTMRTRNFQKYPITVQFLLLLSLVFYFFKSKKSKTLCLRENEKFRETVIACSYGAHVEFFEKKYRKI